MYNQLSLCAAFTLRSCPMASCLEERDPRLAKPSFQVNGPAGAAVPLQCCPSRARPLRVRSRTNPSGPGVPGAGAGQVGPVLRMSAACPRPRRGGECACAAPSEGAARAALARVAAGSAARRAGGRAGAGAAAEAALERRPGRAARGRAGGGNAQRCAVSPGVWRAADPPQPPPTAGRAGAGRAHAEPPVPRPGPRGAPQDSPRRWPLSRRAPACPGRRAWRGCGLWWRGGG